VIRRAVIYDGFNGGNVPLAEMAPLGKEIKAAAAAAGRDPATLHIVSRGSFQLHATPKGPDRRPLWGSMAEIREDVERYAEAGLTELFLEANSIRGASLWRGRSRCWRPSRLERADVARRLACRSGQRRRSPRRATSRAAGGAP
jgi:hypothetical protein